MSNKDCNGYELPWILMTETIEDMGGKHTRSRITVNPSHLDAPYMGPSWALAMAMRDAVVLLQAPAMAAVAAHIRDAHKF